MYHCEAHNRHFISERALNQHLNSPAHEEEFYCEAHNRHFRSEEALNQHLNSLAHDELEEEEEEQEEEEVVEFYCEAHNRHFRSEEALNQHLNSSAHYELVEEDEEEEVDDMPPLIEGLEGEWVPTDEFRGSKSFGYFKCECTNWWFSAHAFPNYKQGCQQCELYYFPNKMWINHSSSINSVKHNGKHDMRRCEACDDGVCLKQN